MHAELKDRIFRIAPGRWQLWRCGTCASAYLDPRPTRNAIGLVYRNYVPPEAPPPASAGRLGDARAAVWNGYVNARYHYDLRPASAVAGSLLRLFPKRRWNADMGVRYLPRPTGSPRLLDVGFGRGDFLAAMRDWGWDARGLEIDSDGVSAARKRGLDVEQGTVEHAPYPPASFDAVTLSHVIEHLHDPVESLRACLRLLKSGGVIWIATPNVGSPGHRQFGGDWFGLDPPRHLVIFTRRGLQLALRSAGFEGAEFRRSYRGRLIVAASEAVGSGDDPVTAVSPTSRASAWRARVLDLAAVVRPEWGEELIALARRPVG